MEKQLKIGFILATLDIDVKWFRPLSYGYLKSYLKEYCEFPVMMNFLENSEVSNDYDIICISATSQCFSIAKDIAKKIKAHNNNCITIIGGHHITYMPETLIDEFDIGVLGEGEETFLELIRYFYKTTIIKPDFLKDIPGIVFHNNERHLITPKRKLINPLDQIPFPDRSNVTDPYLFTSRGCPYKCSFCSSTDFWDQTRFFSADYVVKEVEHVLEMFPHYSQIGILDDLFIANKPRFKRFIQLLEEKKYNERLSFSFSVRANLVDDELCQDLKKINVVGVSFGAESGSDRILKVLQKGTTVEMNQQAINLFYKYNIPLRGSFIVGVPTETEDEVRCTYEFILKNIIDGKLMPGCSVNILMPMPGTEVWRYAIKSGIIDPQNIDWSRLSIFASYRDSNLESFDEWVTARKKNNSLYLAEETLPESRLYEIMYLYENVIKFIELTKEQNKAYQTQLDIMRNSLSWKITGPLRHLRKLFFG